MNPLDPELECEYCIRPILRNEPKVLTSDGWMDVSRPHFISFMPTVNGGFDDAC